MALSEERKPIIGFGYNMGLNHLELIPDFFNAIENKQVLRFVYNVAYREKVEILFHPYYIKEYNGRWFVLGKSFDLGHKPLKYANIAIDRVDNVPAVMEEEYIPNNRVWEAHFTNIIGVTSGSKKKPVEIRIETSDTKTFFRIKTKPLHKSQKCLCEPNEAEGRRGMFSINVIPNDEMYSLFLSYQTGMRVISPSDIADEMKKRIEMMMQNYKM